MFETFRLSLEIKTAGIVFVSRLLFELKIPV
jgi:hypothetical protein